VHTFRSAIIDARAYIIQCTTIRVCCVCNMTTADVSHCPGCKSNMTQEARGACELAFDSIVQSLLANQKH
jgi:hypothetical protein